MRVQDKIAPDVDEEMKQNARDRKGAILIDVSEEGVIGPEGCIIYLRWDGEHLVEDPTAAGVRNDFKLKAQTLQDLVLGELDPREAIAARLIEISGDRSIYDSEDILRVLTQLIEKMRTTVGNLKRKDHNDEGPTK